MAVRGPCFTEFSNIQCQFGEETMMAIYESVVVARCTVPPLPRTGRVRFRVLIDGVVRGEGIYTACEFVC